MDERLPHIRAILQTTPTRWETLTAELPEDLLQQAPAPGEWAAIDCLRHLRDAERDVFQIRVRAFRARQDLAPYDPERQGSAPRGESPAALAEDFARLRAAGLALLAEVKPEELDITVTHAEFGRVRLRELLHEWAAHDLMHTVQAERALMQPFVAGSGPWRVTFADHDVAADVA